MLFRSSFEKPFKLAAKKFDLIPVLLQDKLETKLPNLPICIDVVDPETGEEESLSLSSGGLDQVLQRYQQTREEELNYLFTPYKIEPILIDTAGSTADPVIAFFKKRAQKIRK